MGYVVKHSTSNVNKTRRKGNVALGVSSEGYDKTSVSGLYAGVPPVEGKHNFVMTPATGDPNFYCVNDTELINFVNSIGGSVSNVTDATTYLAAQSDIMFTNNIPSDAITDSLVLDLKASNISSYPGSGTTWYDLSGNGNNAALISSFDSEFRFNSEYFESRPTEQLSETDSNDGSVWQVPYSSELSPTNEWTVGGLLRINGSQSPNGTGWFHKTGNGDERGIHIEPIGSTFRINGASGWSHLNVTVTDYHNKWTYYTATYKTTGTYGTNTGNLKFYANGELLGSLSTFIPTADTTSVIRLGRRNGHFQHFLNGDTATYQYYTKELSQSEILQNYYGCPIITDGLVFAADAGNLASYESGSTSVYDLTGNVAAGSLLNGAYGDGNWFVFDGTNDELEFPHYAIYKNPEISVDFWVQLDYESSGRHVMFTSWYGFTVEINNTSGAITWGLQGLDSQYMGGAYLDYGVPTHISCTYNPTTDKQRIYVNGELKAEQTASGTINYGSSSLRFSGDWDRTRGRMGFMKIYNKELSKDEVLQNYNAQKSKFIDYLGLGEVETNGEWLKVFRHYSGNGAFFSNANDWAEAKQSNQGNPWADKYSILHALDKFCLDSKYTFKLHYPGPAITNIWSQINNPVTDNGSGGVTGYSGISIATTANGWGGLERYDSQTSTFLDGTLTPQGNWYYAVGVKDAWGGTNTFPGPSSPVNEVELWVKYK